MYRRMAEGRTVTCKGCGLHVEPAQVNISPSGALMCWACAGAERAGQDGGGRLPATLGASFGALAAGLVPLWVSFRPMHEVAGFKAILGSAALTAGLLAVLAARRLASARDRRALGRFFPWTAAAAATGGLSACVGVVAAGPIFIGASVLGWLVWRGYRWVA